MLCFFGPFESISFYKFKILGPIEYKCYNFTPTDIQWKNENSATEKDVCERHRGNTYSSGENGDDFNSIFCGKDCTCCRIDGRKFQPLSSFISVVKFN